MGFVCPGGDGVRESGRDGPGDHTIPGAASEKEQDRARLLAREWTRRTPMISRVTRAVVGIAISDTVGTAISTTIGVAIINSTFELNHL